MSTEDLDPENIDKAVQMCEAKGANIIFGGIVTKIHDRKGSAKRILVVSDSFITYVKKPKNPVLSRTHSWKDLTFINMINQDGVEMLFNQDKFRFTTEQTPQIARKILDLLLHTFSTKKVSQLDLARFPHSNISVNPRGVLARFDSQLISSNLKPHESKFRKTLKQNLEQRSPTFKAVLEEDEDSLILTSALLYAMIPSPYTTGLFLPAIQSSEVADKLYIQAADFVKRATTADFVNFEMPITKSFTNLTEKFTEIATTHINGIGFSSIDVTDDSINQVSNFLSTEKVVSLRWTNINPINSIETLLKAKPYTQKLRFIALDKTKGVRFEEIAPLLSNIVVLSLEYCDLELSDAFRIIHNNKFPELKLLNLSYNNSSKPIDKQVTIPSTIERIDISHVKFTNCTMKTILEFILSSQYDHGLKFYCDKFYVKQSEQIDEALSSFENLQFNSLIEFSWRKNKITKEVFDFLGRNKSLKKLMLDSNIVTNDETNTVPLFSEACSNLTNLTHLYINGNKKANFSTSFNDVLDALKKLPVLEFLDISKNYIGDEGFDQLSSSLNELPSLTHIVFDTNKPKTIQSIHNFILASNQLHRTIHVSYPQHDIESLLKKKKIDDDGVENVKNAINSLLIDVNTITMPPAPKLTPTSFDDSNSKSKKSSKLSAKRNSIRLGSNKRNSIRLTNSKQQATTSAYIRAGSVRNVKRPLLAGEFGQQDPDSLFIKPFDMWVASIEDTEFPLYLTEQLQNELSIDANDTVAVLDQSQENEKNHSRHRSKTRHHHSKGKSQNNEDDQSTENETNEDSHTDQSINDDKQQQDSQLNENEQIEQSNRKHQKDELNDQLDQQNQINEQIERNADNQFNENNQIHQSNENKLQDQQNDNLFPTQQNQSNSLTKTENKHQDQSNEDQLINQQGQFNESKQSQLNHQQNQFNDHQQGQFNDHQQGQLNHQQGQLNPENKHNQTNNKQSQLNEIKKNELQNQYNKEPKLKPIIPFKERSPMKSPDVIKPVKPAPQLVPLDQVIQPLPVIEKIENVRNSPKQSPRRLQHNAEVTRISHIGSNSDDDNSIEEIKQLNQSESDSNKENDIKERNINSPIDSESEDDIPISSNRKLPPLPQKHAVPPQLSPTVPKSSIVISSSSSDLQLSEHNENEQVVDNTNELSSENDNQIENPPKSPSKVAAPHLEIKEPDFDDDIVDAVPFEPLTWSFPIPRTTRVSNKRLLQELNEKYSTQAVINSIKSRK